MKRSFIPFTAELHLFEMFRNKDDSYQLENSQKKLEICVVYCSASLRSHLSALMNLTVGV